MRHGPQFRYRPRSHPHQFGAAFLVAFSTACVIFLHFALRCAAAEGATVEPRVAEAVLADGRRISGTLAVDDGDFYFYSEQLSRSVGLGELREVTFPPLGPGRTTERPHDRQLLPAEDAPSARPTVRLRFWDGARITGRLLELTDRIAEIDLGDRGTCEVTTAAIESIEFSRGGRAALILDEDFEQPADAWQFSRAATAPLADADGGRGRALAITAPAKSTTRRLDLAPSEAVVELAFYDDARLFRESQWCMASDFGPYTVAVLGGWDSEFYGVESLHGPSLAVRPLERTPGWHRLRIEFDTEALRITIDDEELARGASPREPLEAIRLFSRAVKETSDQAASQAVTAQMAMIDDLRITKRRPAANRPRRDATQDATLLDNGDEWFGAIQYVAGGPFRVHGTQVPLETVSTCYLRRREAAPRTIAGQIVRACHESPLPFDGDLTAGDSLDVIEGALVAADPQSITLEHPYAGEINIALDMLRRLEVRFAGRSIELFPARYHLGNEVCEDLMLPVPDGATLELPFELDDVGAANFYLTLEATDLEPFDSPRFGAELARGRLRTSVLVNGHTVDDLNRHVSAGGRRLQSVRLAIPRDCLVAGVNRLRIEQIPRADDPQEFDDCTIGRLRLEMESAP